MDEEPGARVARVPPPVAPEVQRAYEARVLPGIAALVAEWWDAYDGADREMWSVRASADDGVFVAAPDDDGQDAICCPRDLNDATLLIGWQSYRNPSIRDPKSGLAERLIALVLASDDLAAHVEIEDMGDIAEDIGLYQRTRGFVSEKDEERAREEREDAEELERQQQQEKDEEDETRRRRREEVRYGGATVSGDSRMGGKNAVKAEVEIDSKQAEDPPPAKRKAEPAEIDEGSKALIDDDAEKNFGRD